MIDFFPLKTGDITKSLLEFTHIYAMFNYYFFSAKKRTLHWYFGDIVVPVMSQPLALQTSQAVPVSTAATV